MRSGSKQLKRNVLSVSIASAMLTASAGAMAQAEALEEVVVTGVRAAQASAVNTKRLANSVVDGIAAQDIGKLPDVTIADSLQRIPGIQVQRTAGEGGPVQIRGLPYVATMLNGESFLSATSIDASDADFGDLPSQLFSGADVYKSPLTTTSTQGIAGTVDLKTRRPFDMEDGWNFAGGAEVDQGSFSKEQDPTLNGLLSWKNDSVGILVSAVTTEKNLATDYNGYFDTSENGGIGSANSNHDWNTPAQHGDMYYVMPQGFAAFHKAEERHRDGANLSFQADLGSGFELVADYFYSEQERWNRRAGISHNNRWQTFADYAYATEFGDSAFDHNGNEWRTVTAYEARPYRLQSFAQTNYNHETSKNANLELNYDNGGALTGQVRVTRASADASMRHGYTEGDLLSIDQGSLVTGPGGLVPAEYCGPDDVPVGDQGGCYAAYSPGGIEDSDFMIGYDVSGEYPAFSGFDQVVNGGQGMMTVADYMASLDSYHVGAFSSEGNTNAKGNLDTFSSKWNYAFEDSAFVESMDFGIRQSERSVDREQFSYFADFADTGCSAQWKAVDQFANSSECNPNLAQGEMVNGEFVPYTLLKPTRIDDYNNVIWVNDFGGVTGLPGVWVADPRDFDDTLAFQEKVFGPQRKVIDPGMSYSVDLAEFSYFLQGNFAYGDFSGNLGVKVVETELTVRQNEVGDGIPHSGASQDIGDIVTKRDYTDILPALNVAYDVTEDVKLRAAYAETMMPLDLLTWGGGMSVGMVFDNASGQMRPANATLSGNPELEPTRAKNMEVSAEWYLGSATMVSAGLFNIDVESFIENGVGTIAVADPVSGTKVVPMTGPIQGTDGNVKGLELAAKLAFIDFLDAPVLSDMGIDANYTLSDSGYGEDASGKDRPFPGNSEHTYNLVGWYETDLISARLAYNFRSERLITSGSSILGLQDLYQDDYGQLDLNVTWSVTDQLDLYLNGSNILEEYQQAYLEFEDQKAFQNLYEARWALGARYTY
ncbi:TonB-dependent receptor [Microbulbifer sp. ALW1]|uniref:TonB-dependent receptor n=1 Tax=Microbulbifer sp. (strain ALW1) TaxID=1516059 RepID=UPI00135735BC|nr:TonB-dependent receptor [Microbulbifer sp. ALW1]